MIMSGKNGVCVCVFWGGYIGKERMVVRNNLKTVEYWTSACFEMDVKGESVAAVEDLRR